jgi:tRNA pseudouridine55 synthase
MTAPSGLVIVDKPSGMTSHDVVARVRRLAGTRRVGHAGTLDPMATGVLVVGVEKATRLLGYLTLTEKTYVATIRLGQSTSTDDAEGAPTGGSPATDIAPGALDAEIAELTGDIWQVPPGVSAIKVNGQRAYKLTRAGAAPELAARPVTVYEFSVNSVREAGDFLDVDAVIRCSSGTYIRALARDLGAALGTGGHLTALRRTAVGPYRLDQAHTLQDLPAPPSTEAASHVARPIAWITPLAEAAAAAFPRFDLTADEARRLAQGARLPLPSHPQAEPSPTPQTSQTDAKTWPTPGTPMAAFAPDDTLVALVTADSGCIRSLAVFIDAPPAARDE